MSAFDTYRDAYEHVRMEREGGVLTLTLHSDGGSIVWGGEPHEELGHCFGDVANDFENEIVIITGAGEAFIGAMNYPKVGKVAAGRYAALQADATRLLVNLLGIGVPVIGAINGPATIHAELGLLSDIVIAADDAVFQDAPHFPAGTVPGDGVHVVWPLLLGPNRGRYFLLTGEQIGAEEALRLGIVSEVMPRDRLMSRARELAAQLMRQPALTRRHARAVLTRRLQRELAHDLEFGLAMEGLAWTEYFPSEVSLRAPRQPAAAE